MLRVSAFGLLALASVGAASASDLIIPTTPQPIYEAGGFDWSGAYAGVSLGGLFADESGLVLAGGVAGYNIIVADPILVGIEFQGTYDWEDIYHSTKLSANVRLGAIVTDDVLVYGIVGAGRYSTNVPHNGSFYQFGGGVELAVTDSVTVRGEVVGIRALEEDEGEIPTWARATVGVSYHF